jgi:chromosome segregation ATPase
LREKLGPVAEENRGLKDQIKVIESEYQENNGIMDTLQKQLDHQESVIGQHKEALAKKEKQLKASEERFSQLAQKLYQFKEKERFDKRSYAELFRELYDVLVARHEGRFRKNPEIADELDKQVQYLENKNASQEKVSDEKKRRLEKLCQNLRIENANLIDELNRTVKKLSETAKKVPYEGRLKTAGQLTAHSDRKPQTLWLKPNRTQEQFMLDSEQSRGGEGQAAMSKQSMRKC